MHALVPVDRLRGAVARDPQGDRLRLRGRDCPSLAADNLCVLHASHGAAAKPVVCSVYPYRYVRTPDGVEAGLYWSCPAVVDGEGPSLPDDRPAVEAALALAEAAGHVTTLAAEVPLTRARTVPWAAARALSDALSNALAGEGDFVSRAHAMAGVAVAYDEALAADGEPGNALAMAIARGPDLAREALGEPLGIDRLSRALFKALLFLAQGEPAQGVWAGAAEAVRSLLGRSTVRLRDGAVTHAAATLTVPGTLPSDGSALLVRWFRAQLRGMAFYGASRGNLTFYEGIEFLLLSSAVAVYLARGHAAAAGRTAVDVAGVRAAILQLESRLVNRTDLPPRFGLALTHTATLDLLREQVGATVG